MLVVSGVGVLVVSAETVVVVRRVLVVRGVIVMRRLGRPLDQLLFRVFGITRLDRSVARSVFTVRVVVRVVARIRVVPVVMSVGVVAMSVSQTCPSLAGTHERLLQYINQAATAAPLRPSIRRIACSRHE